VLDKWTSKGTTRFVRKYLAEPARLNAVLTALGIKTVSSIGDRVPSAITEKVTERLSRLGLEAFAKNTKRADVVAELGATSSSNSHNHNTEALSKSGKSIPLDSAEAAIVSPRLEPPLVSDRATRKASVESRKELKSSTGHEEPATPSPPEKKDFKHLSQKDDEKGEHRHHKRSWDDNHGRVGEFSDETNNARFESEGVASVSSSTPHRSPEKTASKSPRQDADRDKITTKLFSSKEEKKERKDKEKDKDSSNEKEKEKDKDKEKKEKKKLKSKTPESKTPEGRTPESSLAAGVATALSAFTNGEGNEPIHRERSSSKTKKV